MPSRNFVWGILLFWMGTMGWMFHRDFWPYLRPGDAPPYTIDLTDEALMRETPEIHWNVYRGNKRLGMVRTWVYYSPHDDTFELHMESNQLDLSAWVLDIQASDVKSYYRVTRKGQLRQIVANGAIAVHVIGKGELLRAEGHVEGVIQDRQFLPKGYFKFGNFKGTLDLEPVDVPEQANVLSPLHPVNRISGLRRGKHWLVPYIDPVGDTIKATMKKAGLDVFFKHDSGVHVLQAEVLSNTEILNWHEREVECLVIAYRGESISARTWIRDSDGLMLRQDVTLGGETLILERDVLKALHIRPVRPKQDESKSIDTKSRPQ
jgi:hypothetical protein